MGEGSRDGHPGTSDSGCKLERIPWHRLPDIQHCTKDARIQIAVIARVVAGNCCLEGYYTEEERKIRTHWGNSCTAAEARHRRLSG